MSEQIDHDDRLMACIKKLISSVQKNPSYVPRATALLFDAIADYGARHPVVSDAKQPTWEKPSNIRNYLSRNAQTRAGLKREMKRIIAAEGCPEEAQDDVADQLSWQVMSYFGYA